MTIFNCANSAANCFNIRAGIWSGPVAFVGSRFLRNFPVPNMVTYFWHRLKIVI
jgi:hypothetical protein